MPFKLVYEKRFINDLNSVENKDKSRIKTKLEWLAENIKRRKRTALKGEEFKNVFKLRVGNWRVFYKIDYHSETIFVLSVMDRKEAYRKR